MEIVFQWSLTSDEFAGVAFHLKWRKKLWQHFCISFGSCCNFFKFVNFCRNEHSSLQSSTLPVIFSALFYRIFALRLPKFSFKGNPATLVMRWHDEKLSSCLFIFSDFKQEMSDSTPRLTRCMLMAVSGNYGNELSINFSLILNVSNRLTS